MNTRNSSRLLLVLAMGCALLLGPPMASGQEMVSVYVAAASDAAEDIPKNKAKDLSDSAEDLRREIKKRKSIVLAEDIESADLTIVILDRRIDIAQNRKNYGGGHIQNHYSSRHVIVYRIQVGEAHHNAEQIAAGSLVTWRSVAKDLSKRLERWARENREQVLRARSDGS